MWMSNYGRMSDCVTLQLFPFNRNKKLCRREEKIYQNQRSTYCDSAPFCWSCSPSKNVTRSLPLIYAITNDCQWTHIKRRLEQASLINGACLVHVIMQVCITSNGSYKLREMRWRCRSTRWKGCERGGLRRKESESRGSHPVRSVLFGPLRL